MTKRSFLARNVRRTRRLMRLPVREQLTTVHAALVLGVVELLVRWVSLPRLSRLLGVRVNIDPVTANAERLPVEDLSEATRRRLRSSSRVANAWPFSRGPCLRRALVSGHLIRNLQPTIRLGVASDGDLVQAHAWLEIDDRPLETIADLKVFQRNVDGARV